MKQTIFGISLSLISFSTYSQVSLKGITLGEKYDVNKYGQLVDLGDGIKMSNPIATTVGGVEGTIKIWVKFGEIYFILFGSKKMQFTSETRAHFDNWSKDIEEHYGIKFKNNEAHKDNVMYIISYSTILQNYEFSIILEKKSSYDF